MACCASCEKGGSCEGGGCTGKINPPPNQVKYVKPYRWKYAFTFANNSVADPISVRGTKQVAYYKQRGTNSPYHGLGSSARSGCAWEKVDATYPRTKMFERRQMSQICRTGGDRIQ